MRFCAQASQSRPNPSQHSTISTACPSRRTSLPAPKRPQTPRCLICQRNICLCPPHPQGKHITSPIFTFATQAPCGDRLNLRHRSKSNAAQRAALFIPPASIHDDNTHHTSRAAEASGAAQRHAAFSHNPPRPFSAHPAEQSFSAFRFYLQSLHMSFAYTSIPQTHISWIDPRAAAALLPEIHSSRLYPLCMQTAAQSPLLL